MILVSEESSTDWGERHSPKIQSQWVCRMHQIRVLDSTTFNCQESATSTWVFQIDILDSRFL